MIGDAKLGSLIRFGESLRRELRINRSLDVVVEKRIADACSLDIHSFVRLVLGKIHALCVVVACNLGHRNDRQAHRGEKDKKKAFDLDLPLLVLFK